MEPVKRETRRGLQPDALHLVLREPLLGAVVKRGRTRAFVGRHFLRVFERAAVGEIGGNPGGLA